MQIGPFHFFKTLLCVFTFNALPNILIVLQDTKHAQITSVATLAVMTSKGSYDALHIKVLQRL